MIVTEVTSSGCPFYFIALEIDFLLIKDKYLSLQKIMSLLLSFWSIKINESWGRGREKINESKDMKKCAKKMKKLTRIWLRSTYPRGLLFFGLNKKLKFWNGKAV